LPAPSNVRLRVTVECCTSVPDDAAQPEPSGVEADRWLAKAADDLTVARLVANTEGAPRWPACFHAQQAAEKALKAYLVANGVDFPFSHALDRLADLIDSDKLQFDRLQLVELQPWAVAGRYPEDVPEASVEEVERLITAADAIRTAVERVVRSGSTGR
jgi:HEPN domain-containing protein